MKNYTPVHPEVDDIEAGIPQQNVPQERETQLVTYNTNPNAYGTYVTVGGAMARIGNFLRREHRELNREVGEVLRNPLEIVNNRRAFGVLFILPASIDSVFFFSSGMYELGGMMSALTLGAVGVANRERITRWGRNITNHIRHRGQARIGTEGDANFPPLPPALTEQQVMDYSFNVTSSMLDPSFDTAVAATPQNWGQNNFLQLANHLFAHQLLDANLKDQINPERLEEARKNAAQLFNSGLDYNLQARRRDQGIYRTDDNVIIQYLALSYMVGTLQGDPTILPNVDRQDFRKKYMNWRDQSFVPYCRTKYGLQSMPQIQRVFNTVENFVMNGGEIDITRFNPPVAPAQQNETMTIAAEQKDDVTIVRPTSAQSAQDRKELRNKETQGRVRSNSDSQINYR